MHTTTQRVGTHVSVGILGCALNSTVLAGCVSISHMYTSQESVNENTELGTPPAARTRLTSPGCTSDLRTLMHGV